jgi:hypothetical protein
MVHKNKDYSNYDDDELDSLLKATVKDIHNLELLKRLVVSELLYRKDQTTLT